MPVYEYWCPHCKCKQTEYVASFNSPTPPCPKCGRQGMERRFSTFSVTKGYQEIYDSILSDTKLKKGLLRDDPHALAEWNKRMSGGEKPTPEYEEMVQRLEHGEMPETPKKAEAKKPSRKRKKSSGAS